MKISKLFHTLYAFLMFLPVMVLPLFAININQKEVEPLKAQIEETEVVDFNQLQSQDYYKLPYGNGSTTYVDNKFYTANYETGSNFGTPLEAPIDLIGGHQYYFKVTYYDLDTLTSVYYNQRSPWGSITNAENAIIYTPQNDAIVELYTYTSSSTSGSATFNGIVIDLTQMFGQGKEPSLQQFNSWYSKDYYQYTLSEKQILHTGIQDTLNNTDVGSQFLYSLYNPLKDYFNLPNYMNLGGLYDWFLVNLFSGYNSPVYFIIFDLMIYWLAMSLLWLIFDVLMYVPSMIHKMLDKARME